jgi:hypothetical protein
MEALDVELGPNFKFVTILVGVCTCGVGALAMWFTARSWPRQLTQEGITTRAGKTVRWADLDQQTRVTAVDHLGRRMAGRLDLSFGKTTVRIVPDSLVQGPQVMAFLSEVLGSEAETG